MAIFDWNHNGKIDMQDEFLEYKIFRACTEEDDDEKEDIFDSDDDFWDYEEAEDYYNRYHEDP